MQSSLYYESHVTFRHTYRYTNDAVNIPLLSHIALKHEFNLADLLMQKDLTKSIKDLFCSARDSHYTLLLIRMQKFMNDRVNNGFEVIRYKIENVVLDSKVNDTLGLFDYIPIEGNLNEF